MSRAKRRLVRLASLLHAVGCSTCKGWEWSRVFVIDPRATEPVDTTPPPSRCPRCGRRIVKYDDIVIEPDLGTDEAEVLA